MIHYIIKTPIDRIRAIIHIRPQIRDTQTNSGAKTSPQQSESFIWFSKESTINIEGVWCGFSNEFFFRRPFERFWAHQCIFSVTIQMNFCLDFHHAPQMISGGSLILPLEKLLDLLANETAPILLLRENGRMFWCHLELGYLARFCYM